MGREEAQEGTGALLQHAVSHSAAGELQAAAMLPAGVAFCSGARAPISTPAPSCRSLPPQLSWGHMAWCPTTLSRTRLRRLTSTSQSSRHWSGGVGRLLVGLERRRRCGRVVERGSWAARLLSSGRQVCGRWVAVRLPLRRRGAQLYCGIHQILPAHAAPPWCRAAPDAKLNEIKGLLGKMLFSGTGMEKKVGSKREGLLVQYGASCCQGAMDATRTGSCTCDVVQQGGGRAAPVPALCCNTSSLQLSST